MVFPRLEGLFGDVAAMVARWHKLVRHISGREFRFGGSGDLIVEDLVGGYDALELHLSKAATEGEDEFTFGMNLHWFGPS